MSTAYLIVYGFAAWFAGGVLVAALFHLAKRHVQTRGDRS